MIHVQILSLGAPERYAVRRLVAAAERDLLAIFPDALVIITELDRADEIGKVARVLVLPTLVINGKVVCTGRYPSREEILAWMREEISKK